MAFTNSEQYFDTAFFSLLEWRPIFGEIGFKTQPHSSSKIESQS